MLTAAQVASALNVHEQTVRRLLISGKLSGRYRLGSKKLGWIVRRDEIARYLRSVGELELADRIESGELPHLDLAS
jgi:excisionase family DNA binding protein